jgi:predicted CoA-binding protein
MSGRELSSLPEVEPVLRAAKVVAVLGCHPEPQRPAHYVPAYLYGVGKKILPVNPRFAGQQIFGTPVVARCDELKEAVDIVDVFRRGPDVAGHVEEILAMKPLPKVVWLQSGIVNDDACAELRQHGIDVVQDR